MTQQRAEELGEAFGKSQQKAIRERQVPALAGMRRNDGTVTLAGDLQHNDLLLYPNIYIRLYALDTNVRQALNAKTGVEAGDEIIVEKTHRNQWHVTGVDDALIAERLGTFASDHVVPPAKGSRTDSNRERSFVPGRLRLHTAGSLLVTADVFLYVNSEGALRIWDPDVEMPLDLADTLPDVHTSGTPQHRYVFITLDPDADAPALVAHEGPEQIATLPLTEFGYIDIEFPAGHIPLGPMRVQTGDTSFTAERFDNTKGKRGWPGRLLLSPLKLAEAGNGLPNFGAAVTIQISSGVLDISAISSRNIIVQAESGSADIVDAIVGLGDGEAVIFQAESGDTITFANNSDIHLDSGVNFAISGNRLLMLVGRGGGVVTQPVDEKGSGGGSGTPVTLWLPRTLYVATLGAAALFDIQEGDLISGSGTFASYDRLEIVFDEMRSTRASPNVSDEVIMLFGTGGGSLDTTSSNYHSQLVLGVSSSAGGGASDTARIALSSAAASPSAYKAFAEIKIYAPGSSYHKRSSSINGYRGNTGTGDSQVRLYSHTWENTSPIDRIGFRCENGSSNHFAAGTTIRIMGYKDVTVLT